MSKKNDNSTLSKKSRVITNLYKSPKWNPNIMAILNKILNYVKISESDIINILNNNQTGTDEKIFNEILKLNFKPENMYGEESDINRAYGRLRHIKNHLSKHITSLLDMGGNVGTTAMVIGRRVYNLPKEKTLVVDIDEWAGNKWVPRDDITFFHYDLMKQIPDNSIDLITCFHNLHHIPTKEYPNIMEHFYRILSVDGCIVLYEHDCAQKEWAGIIDIEHALYDVVVSKKIAYDKFVQTTHYAKYMGINKWKALFEKAGFKKYFTNELHNIDNSFYMFFRKV
jgi:ubiquinone/menaquinone biosynthesis C-methylase UbiE